MARSFALLLVLALSQFAHGQEVTALAYVPDGTLLIYAGLHGRLEFVDPDIGRELWHTQAHFGGVFGVAVSPKGTHLASCGADKKVRLWKLVTRPTPSAQELMTLSDQDGEVVAVAFSPDGRTLASGGYDKTIRLWEVDGGKLLAKLEGHKGAITSLVFSPDGKTLASTGFNRFVAPPRITSQDDQIHLWDLVTRKFIETLPQRAHQTAFSPDGRFLVSVGHYLKATGKLLESDSDITMWDMNRRRGVFQHKEFQRTLALSADGKWLATGLGNGLHGNGIATFDKKKTKGVQLWEVASGKPVTWQPVESNEQAVVALSPNGTKLAVGHKAGNVTLLSIAPDPQVNLEKLETLWDALMSDDAPAAFEAIASFVARGDKAVAFLKSQLQAGVPAGAKVRKLIGELNNERFPVREAAHRELLRLGIVAEAELRRTLLANPNLETERRIQQLLAVMPNHPASREELRQCRAIVVLRRIGTDEACRHLESLAQGEAGAWLTQEAQACLRFLTRSGQETLPIPLQPTKEEAPP